MNLTLGETLRIRAMVYVAGEPIPMFWPMRAFIHHNPLHALEGLPFEQAVLSGRRIFHGRGFLSRQAYQAYLAQGRIAPEQLAAEVAAFLAEEGPLPGLDLQSWLYSLLTEQPQRVALHRYLASAEDVAAVLGGASPDAQPPDPARLAEGLRERLLGERPLYESVDALFGTEIGEELDELVIKSCLDFFDEGQSVWAMPGREQGFFAAWRELALRNVRFALHGLDLRRIIGDAQTAEAMIVAAMERLGVARVHWSGYFTRELARLHGWAGFVRWRASAKRYYWNQRYPADLVDLLAVRLIIGLGLLVERRRRTGISDAGDLERAIADRPREMFLRHQLYSAEVLPAMAQRVEAAVLAGRQTEMVATFDAYVAALRQREAQDQAAALVRLAGQVGDQRLPARLAPVELAQLLGLLRRFEAGEGMRWLRAMEAQSMGRLLGQLRLEAPVLRDKRPFVQALFCIDTRSERIRRQLEGVGDYQTYGIAGFFGVPLSFMELGKGSESHLCPVLLTPRNLVLEMTIEEAQEQAPLSAMDKALHRLKESVLTPFVTVEAIGLLFGFDMIGKTLAPHGYNRWRKRLHQAKPQTHLLLDKLSNEQADSIVRAVQRSVIIKALEQEFELEPESVTDDLVRALREAAMGHEARRPLLPAALGLDGDAEAAFIRRLRDAHRINPAFARLQMERLGRIGFSLDEQANMVAQALRSIGLSDGHSRFVLLVGHGSSSENNPYESALDCGACAGSHGLVNARVLAQMANRTAVRQRLRAKGVEIAEDAWFLPALHNTTTDEIQLFDLERLPSTHLVYLDRLRAGLRSAARLCAQERVPELDPQGAGRALGPAAAYKGAMRNAHDWSQVRPEWGLSRNAYFIIGRRQLTERLDLAGRAFLHSYDYRLDRRNRLLETILTGPLVVGQWINMEHYFSAVDNERYGSGSKVYHNVTGRFGVMTGNLSDLRTGLPSQTVLLQGRPYHEPQRLITLIEAPFAQARSAVEAVTAVKNLVANGWIRLLVLDPQTGEIHLYEGGDWRIQHRLVSPPSPPEEAVHAS